MIYLSSWRQDNNILDNIDKNVIVVTPILNRSLISSAHKRLNKKYSEKFMDNIILFQDGLVLFFGTFFIEIERAVLIALVVIAAIFDIHSHRIPNWLVFWGIVTSVVFHSVSPFGIGAVNSIEGFGVGLASFMPLYIIRAMGAGDVKLMAMVGAFLGPTAAFGAVITTFIVGGVLAITAASLNKSTRRMFSNIRSIMTNTIVNASIGTHIQTDISTFSAGKLPYAVAIALGTIAHILLLHTGHALIS
ncbi:MAG: peptidase prepilin type [Herminiimonas sp.]|nr:peptidase prepilin type [Herminiimonas sp.]